MKTKTVFNYIAAFFAYVIACSVLLAHTHAGDIVKHSTDKLKIQAVAARTDDMHAKVMGEMHTHIDKTSLKNVAATIAARRRTVTAEEAIQEATLSEQIVNNFLLLRVMLTLPVGSFA